MKNSEKSYGKSLTTCPARLVDGFAETLRPAPPLDVVTWLEGDPCPVVLPARSNAKPGPLNLDFTPYLRDPLRRFTDYGVQKIFLCFGRQTGKTTTLFILLGYIVDYDPGPTALMLPTEQKGKAMSKDRIQPLILESPVLQRHLTGNPDDIQRLVYWFDTCTVRIYHAGTEISGRSDPIRYYLEDESSIISVSASINAEATTKSFWNNRIVKASTPDNPRDNIWRALGLVKREEHLKGEELWDSSAWVSKGATSTYFYEVPCPHCGKFFRFEWSGVRWPTDCAIRELDARGWYECPICRGRIEDGQKPAMLTAGTWRCDNPGGKWVGYHLNSLYSPHYTCRFGSIAQSGLMARMSKDPEVKKRFVNNELALPYEMEQEAVDLVTKDDILACQKALAYKRNTLPADVKCLTMGIDVGKAAHHYIIRGWGSGGRSWLIAWGTTETADELEVYIREQARFQHPAGMLMTVIVGAIDSRYDRPSVIRFCKLFRGRIFPVQGERTVIGPDRASIVPHRPRLLERDELGRQMDEGLISYRVNTVYWKQFIYSRMNRKKGREVNWFFPIEAPDDHILMRHLESEHEVWRHKRGTATIEAVWEPKPGYVDNHYLDSDVYCCAITDAKHLMAWTDESKPVTGFREPKPKASSEGGTVRRPQNPFGSLDW